MPDCRVFASFYISLHLIRICQATNVLNPCIFNFEHIDRFSEEEKSALPKAWHVQISYYNGRFLMFHGNIFAAKQMFAKAFGLASSVPEDTKNK